jgi:hypothetical protein
MGDRTSALEMTWIRKTSDMLRLGSAFANGQLDHAHLTSVRKSREIKTCVVRLNASDRSPLPSG